MTASSVPVPANDEGPLRVRLETAVRSEFRGSSALRIAPDDVLFGQNRCGVAGCGYRAGTRGLCSSHYDRWQRQGRPQLDLFVESAGVIRQSVRTARVGMFELGGLGAQARLEIAYVVQCRKDDPRRGRLVPSALRSLIRLVDDAEVNSLLDQPLRCWLETAATDGCSRPRLVALLRYGFERLSDLAEGTDAETEFTRDTWRAAALGVPTTQKELRIRFGPISQPWLREAAKRWARFRLGAGRALETVRNDAEGLCWFSRFLAEQHPEVADEAAVTREIIEHYLSWLGASDLKASTRSVRLVSLRGFLEACRRHGWLPRLPAEAILYPDELPPRPRPLPRFVPEFVMSQLEDPDMLACLPDDTTRNLVVVLIETGLRASDACALPFNPIIDDSAGWPCLHFYDTKMAQELLVPLSPRAADAIRAQQAHLRQRWPDRSPSRLFPRLRGNPDGDRPYCYETLQGRLGRWQQTIDLRDEAGQPVRASAHQFRHTLGTRMINQGVPQHLVQKLLGHASPEMTGRYAHIHDATLRQAFDDYQRRRVDITGRQLTFDPDAPSADAEWIKHNLARVQASLPNGYCGRPPQQDCPHPNACLTCPDFQTTPQFLPIHRRQRDGTLELLTAAEQAGNTRLAANHRQVATNLERIIDTLEAIDSEEPTDAAR